MEKRLKMFLASLFLCVGGVMAQTTVKGTIISADDGEPLPGVSVKVLGEKTGTVTDMNGQFTIEVPNENTRLEFTHIGMLRRVVKARNGMQIALDTDNQLLDEVLVVGFGTAKKSAFTGAAKVLDADVLAQSQVTDITNALAGQVPGVQLVSSSGAPGASSSIRIRGISSINAGNDPLIIVDGAPFGGDLNLINPQDIESMTVTKDAAANALYGARGANGVIQIVTKKAKHGDAKVTLDAKYGWNTRALQHYDVIKSPVEYYEANYTAMNNYYLDQGLNATDAWVAANKLLISGDGLGYNVYNVPAGQYLIGRDGLLNPNATLGNTVNYKGKDYYLYPDNWENEGTRTGIRQEYNVNIASASDRGNFYMSLGYLDMQGISYNSDLKRFTGRLKGDYQVKDWLKVGGNVSYARFDANSLGNNGSTTSSGNIWAFTTQMAPIYPLYFRNADGSIMVDDNGIQVMDYGDGKNAGLGRPLLNDANPLQDILLNTRNNEGHASTGYAFADITFAPGLVLTVNGSYDWMDSRYTYVYNPYYGQFNTTGGTVSKYQERSYDYNMQQLLNYTFTAWDVNNFTFMAGHEYSDQTYSLVGASKSQMFSQENKELDGAVIDGQGATSYKVRVNREGWLGRLLYDYDNRYYLQGSIRRDASSNFHPDYKWGTFWSAGAAWRIGKEKWFNVKWVDELKLKASLGQQGNDALPAPTDDELAQTLYYTDMFKISNSGGKIGTSFANKGNREITWETNTSINLGLEFELWKKLRAEVQYYRRNTKDMLFSFNVAPSLGYTSRWDNIGDMYNEGVEIDLNYNPIHTKNFDWNINLNLSTVKNRITLLHEDQKTDFKFDSDGNAYGGYNAGNFWIAEDLAIYSWYLKEYAGVNENGESLWYKNVYQKDANGDDVLVDGHKVVESRETTTTWSQADFYVHHETTLPKAFGGFGTSFNLYGFDFSINFSYQIGGKQYDNTYANFMSSPSSSHMGYNIHKDVLDAWTPTNTGSDIPRFQYADLYSASASDRFLTDASYLNIENINLGYTLPKAWTRKALIESCRLYFAAENVFYWSKRKGFDPRQSFTSVTNATRYAPIRTLSVGATLTF